MLLVSRHDQAFSILAKTDQTNRRLWVQEYQFRSPSLLRKYLKDFAREQGLEKIIMPVKEEDLGHLRSDDFVVEGFIEGYFPSSKGYFLSAYPYRNRGISDSLSEEQKMLQNILSQPQPNKIRLPKGLSMRQAERMDTFAMSELLNEVFSSYPTPVNDPCYLERSLKKGDLYMVIYDGQYLAGVATAEIEKCYNRAELTNCATRPNYRGLGLNTILLKELERRCLSEKIHCLYSLARASSYGMNLVLHRLGYVFGGTLVNNCHIAGRFENMHIWTKPVQPIDKD